MILPSLDAYHELAIVLFCNVFFSQSFSNHTLHNHCCCFSFCNNYCKIIFLRFDCSKNISINCHEVVQNFIKTFYILCFVKSLFHIIILLFSCKMILWWMQNIFSKTILQLPSSNHFIVNDITIVFVKLLVKHIIFKLKC